MAQDGARHASQTSNVETARFFLVVSHEVFDGRCGDTPNPNSHLSQRHASTWAKPVTNQGTFASTRQRNESTYPRMPA
eukprot:5470880-Pleurochrysis_carterae.AAC.1